MNDFSTSPGQLAMEREMHTQLKIFSCSIFTDLPLCTILSTHSSVAHVLPPMSSVSEPTASIRNPFYHRVL